MISLIDRQSSGSIYVENEQINFDESNKNDILRANKIGIIYQQDNLLPDFTALENVVMPLIIKCEKTKISIAKATKFLKDVKILNRKNEIIVSINYDN